MDVNELIEHKQKHMHGMPPENESARARGFVFSHRRPATDIKQCKIVNSPASSLSRPKLRTYQ